MKKSTLTLTIIGIALTSCNPTSGSKADADSTRTSEIVTNMDDGHNSRNSLSYTGTYKGMLPCADCAGVETVITLNENGTYTKKTTYLGKSGKNTFEEKGEYNWNSAGQYVILEGQEAPNQYLVGENILTQLDITGQKIEGDLAAMYVLKK